MSSILLRPFSNFGSTNKARMLRLSAVGIRSPSSAGTVISDTSTTPEFIVVGKGRCALSCRMCRCVFVDAWVVAVWTFILTTTSWPPSPRATFLVSNTYFLLLHGYDLVLVVGQVASLHALALERKESLYHAKSIAPVKTNLQGDGGKKQNIGGPAALSVLVCSNYDWLAGRKSWAD